jgi:serpin B
MRSVLTTLLTLAGLAGGDGSMTELVRGNTRFGFDLYGRLRAQSGNLFLSPYSISNALAMTYAGARGATAEQMARTLHFSQPPAELHPAWGTLIRQMNGKEAEARPYQLSIANALWGQQGDVFLPEFLKLIEANYGAALRQVDFRSTAQACRTINAWVEEQTRDKIKDLLKPELLGPDTSLVLTNAIYFKGTWADPFPRNATRDEEFTIGTGVKARVPMMHRGGRLGYLEGESFQALEIPYAGNTLSMTILLPRKNDGLPELEKALTAAKLADWLAKLTPRRVDVALPRFKIEAAFELNDVLAAMGMPAAFDDADFSGMNGKRDLFISAVVHKAFVDVNEEGTEAAAATGVVMTRAMAHVEPVTTFRADHPFVFLIREVRTGTILFLGRVADPRG